MLQQNPSNKSSRLFPQNKMYEIPHQLEYKEKIVFGLTFSQLVYALLFFPFVFMFFLKINASLFVRIFLTMIPVSLAVGFMFFDLLSHINNWYTWFKTRDLDEKEKLDKNISYGTIEKDLIYHKKKKLAILEVESLNFSIKSQEEKDTITYSFQKLLNAIDFPIQILMTTETLDLNKYLSQIKGTIEDKERKKIFDSYKQHMKKIITENGAMNRNFYVVIPEISDINIQIKLCEERLHSFNLKTKRLKNQELESVALKVLNKDYIPRRIRNFSDFLVIDENNTKTNTIEQKRNFVKLLYAEEEKYLKGKTKKEIENFRQLDKKERINILKPRLENRTFHRTIYAYGYPRKVESGFLDKLVSCSGNFDFSLHINPQPIEQTIVTVNKELQKQRADLYAAKLKNQLNPSLEIKYKDTRGILEELQKGNEKLFDVSLYINCRAKSLEELNLLTRKIESELNSLLIIPRKPTFQMLNGLKSSLPLAEDLLKNKRNVTTSALSAFFPFTSSFFKFDKTGVWFGLNKNNIPIIRDIFKLSNSNGLCLASSGAGKSYLTKLMISRHLLNGTKVIVIDPQGEYKGLVSRFKGQRIDLSRVSKTIINPLDLMGHDYAEKRLSLMDLMPVMLGDISEAQKPIIDQALTEAYESKGITLADEESWDNEPPILQDVLKPLENMEKNASSLEKVTFRSLINRLRIYVDGVFSFFNKDTNINFNNDFVCFDIGAMPKQVKPIVMFLILDYVYMKMKKTLDRKLLVIDEAWTLLSRAEDASYIFEIVKTCRKFNMGLFLINQEVEGIFNSEAGRSVLANSSYTLLLRQKPAVIQDIQKTFYLSTTERMALLTAGVGEGLLLMEDEHSKIKVVASPEEHKQITTNADELIQENKNEKKEFTQKKKRVRINVDKTKRFFRLSEINKHEEKFLLEKNYQKAEFRSIVTQKKEIFLLKPRHNETLKHHFVTYDTAEYLVKKGYKVEMFTTKKPDIVFSKGNKKYAIEVETGSGLSKISRMKEKLQVLKNYDGWFFVVTNKNKIAKYREFGQSLDLRYLKTQLNRYLRQIANSHSA